MLRAGDDFLYGGGTARPPVHSRGYDKDEIWVRVVGGLIEVKFRTGLPRGFVRQTGLPGVSLAV